MKLPCIVELKGGGYGAEFMVLILVSALTLMTLVDMLFVWIDEISPWP